MTNTEKLAKNFPGDLPDTLNEEREWRLKHLEEGGKSFFKKKKTLGGMVVALAGAVGLTFWLTREKRKSFFDRVRDKVA